MKKPLTLNTVGRGNLITQAEEGLEKAIQDALNRCHILKPRKVIVTIEVKPTKDFLYEVSYEVKNTNPGEKVTNYCTPSMGHIEIDVFDAKESLFGEDDGQAKITIGEAEID